MKVYKLPADLKAIVFDIDLTLYTNQAYAHEQIDCQVREYARVNGMTADEARAKVAAFRKEYARLHDRKKVSLGNTLLSFGVPIEQSIKWREELVMPEKFLKYDEKLVATIKQLKTKYKIICVTNNPVLPARKTLEVIGVSDYIPEIVGLDTCFKSKPAREPFEEAVKRLCVDVSQCVAIGDRYDLDVALPMDMGMGGIVVDGVEDVYKLPELLHFD